MDQEQQQVVHHGTAEVTFKAAEVHPLGLLIGRGVEDELYELHLVEPLE